MIHDYQADTSWLTDPLKFQRMCWPNMTFYDKQVDIIESVVHNDETIVPAANQLGKDFIAGFITVWFFCSRRPCRVITSSAGQGQLKSVLWGEIRRFISTSRVPLPLDINDLLLRHRMPDGSLEPRSYVRGVVTNTPENLQGHHLERGPNGEPSTLFIADEASSIETQYKDATDTWAHKTLVIGNPLPCTNFFFHAVNEGDIERDGTDRFLRKVIRIKATDSPNVRLAESQKALGKEPTNEILVPGVVDYETYCKRRKLWDAVRQCIGLDAEFYRGAEVLLYPPEWLNHSEKVARDITTKGRNAKAIGIDPAEGGDKSSWTVIDELGILEQISMKTPNTADIPNRTIALIDKYGVDPTNVIFDRGGGGKQHADKLREQGYPVRSIGFGEGATDPDQFKRMRTSFQKREAQETRYVYKNRRAEMYGLLRELIDPEGDNGGWGIPEKLTELRRQLAPIPLLYDPEGRLTLPPKGKGTAKSNIVTLKDILGCSPDEADSLVLAVFGMVRKATKKRIGAL